MLAPIEKWLVICRNFNQSNHLTNRACAAWHLTMKKNDFKNDWWFEGPSFGQITRLALWKHVAIIFI
jgi:hypothetical protein